MKHLLSRGAAAINRRRMIQGTTAAAFGAFAALSTGQRPALAQLGPCSGPYGTGYCGSSQCNGASCRRNNPYGIDCVPITGHCDNDSCWQSSGHTCCDCHCRDSGISWYCYCHG
jgi:hypothetical protein